LSIPVLVLSLAAAKPFRSTRLHGCATGATALMIAKANGTIATTTVIAATARAA
jgi:hypothetical protein